MLRLPFLALLVASAQAVSAENPNVLFIAIDDLNGWVGSLGNHPHVQTPNIDRLAARGVLFTNAHCAAPACNPSRVAVMTGLAPTTSGVYFNNQDWRESDRLADAITLPEAFRNRGYEVRGGGKLYHAASLSDWGHEGYLDGDAWHEFFPSKSQQLAIEAKPDPFPANGSMEFYRGHFDWAALEIEDDEMGDAKVVSWAEEQLAQPREKPLFLAVGIYRPHIPWWTPKKYFDLYPLDEIEMPETLVGDLEDVPEAGQAMARRHWHAWMEENAEWKKAVQGYLASVTFADAMVGRLLDALDAGPMNDETIVVLWSDHGYHLGHKEHWEKFALWEQTTNVPLIVAGAEIEPEQRSDRPVSLLDIFPTLAELCDLEIVPELDGDSLVPLLVNPQAETNRSVIITQGPGNHAVRSQGWRYIRYADGTEELYDRNEDPNEFRNLAGMSEFRAIKEEHAERLPETEAELDPLQTKREGK